MKSILLVILQQKNMYKGKALEEYSIIHKCLSTSLLTETPNQVIERQIDNYTRLLEQDKRKFFRVQENRNQVVKEHSKKTKELDSLKSRQFNDEMVKMNGEVKILERDLEKVINAYNEVISSNKKLKGQIDELRKEKLIQKDVMRKLTFQIEDYGTLMTQQKADIVKRKEAIEQAKQNILNVKAQNESEVRMFREEVSNVKMNLANSKSGVHLLKRKSEMEQKNEGTDTQPLVRYRLRHLLARNKQRVKIIENYRRTMEAIWKSFEEIKEESGISDLEEITSVFLKHQHQNHFIYEYIDKLSREIEDLNDSMDQLRQQVDVQKEVNQSYLQDLGTTPKKELLKLAKARFQERHQREIADLEKFLRIADPELKELGGDQDLNRFNLTQELAKLQVTIDQYYPVREEPCNVFHEEVTRYTKGPPGYSEELKDNREEKLMQCQKLREFACDFWEKRRGKPQLK